MNAHALSKVAQAALKNAAAVLTNKKNLAKAAEAVMKAAQKVL